MQLTVPQRAQADVGSFPVTPGGVAQWLKGLNPLDSRKDAREIYRGLKHSNRLQNSVDQRRGVLSCFIPVLRELHSHLSEMSLAQPLPLSREFAKNARLADALHREEAFAFKILLSESPTPLADDAGRAMQALAKQAESVIHGYRSIPDALIRDAHQLYQMAEKHGLLSGSQGADLLSLQDHYRFILLLCTADLKQQRVRQLPLLVDFLKSCLKDIHIEKDRDVDSLVSYDYAVNLVQGSRPEPALSLMSENQTDNRWFSVAPVLYRIDTYSANLPALANTNLGVDSLERQSLARLHVALSKTRQRRSARKISFDARRIVFGHKEVCAHLLYQLEDQTSHDTSHWRVVNTSSQGMCIRSEQCRAALVQVGELISVTDPEVPLKTPDTSKSSKLDASLCVVRWVKALGNEGIVMGVEVLARSVLPVRVLREERNPITAQEALNSTDTEDDASENNFGVGENALIIACKVQNAVLQTLLTPPFLYQTTDRLTASQGGRSRKMQLRDCLQSNGLFSQFSLVDVSD